VVPSEKLLDGNIWVMAVTDPDRLALTAQSEVRGQLVALAVKLEIQGPLLAGTEIGVVGVNEIQEGSADTVRGPVDTTESESELEHAAANNSARQATREPI